MTLLESIERGWAWSGIKPVEVVGDNDFGNLIVKDEEGRYWRLCPEDLYCKVVAADRPELDELSRNQVFLHDWYMTELVAEAKNQLGLLRPGYKYCFKIPSVLGGEYGGTNFATSALVGLIEASGHVAQQIEGLPNGAKVRLRITE